MKRLGIFVLFASLAGGVFAQDLDTVRFTDQMNVGTRGNNTAANSNTASSPTGSEYLDYSGPDLTISVTTSVRYINTWAAGTESPVLNVTAAHTNPDRSTIQLPAIPANTRPGATGPETAVLVGDNGGHNGLYFGDTDDSDYYVEVDVYCENLSGAVGFELVGVVARAARDNDPTMTDFTFNPDRAGSYGIYYDLHKNQVKAGRWTTGNTVNQITGYDPASFTQFGATISPVIEGWHTMKIVCLDNQITYSFDGVEIASVTDTTFAFGRPGVYLRETNVDAAAETMGYFDQLRAGPALSADVSDWNLY